MDKKIHFYFTPRRNATFLFEYAMSVIVGRAFMMQEILKPIKEEYFAMYELGLTPDRPFRKCARVVGDVLVVPSSWRLLYDALVRLVQNFST